MLILSAGHSGVEAPPPLTASSEYAPFGRPRSPRRAGTTPSSRRSQRGSPTPDTLERADQFLEGDAGRIRHCPRPAAGREATAALAWGRVAGGAAGSDGRGSLGCRGVLGAAARRPRAQAPRRQRRGEACRPHRRLQPTQSHFDLEGRGARRGCEGPGTHRPGGRPRGVRVVVQRSARVLRRRIDGLAVGWHAGLGLVLDVDVHCDDHNENARIGRLEDERGGEDSAGGRR